MLFKPMEEKEHLVIDNEKVKDVAVTGGSTEQFSLFPHFQERQKTM